MNIPISLRPAGPDDLAAVYALLEQCGLPIADLQNNDRISFWLADSSGGTTPFVGVIGLERAGTFGLLRSLAVAPASRARGIARLLVEAAELAAHADGLRALYLIAMDERAAGCLAHLGYTPIARDLVPLALRSLAEFTGLCPDSNPCLRKTLDPSFVETAIAMQETGNAGGANPCGCCRKSEPLADQG